MIEMTAEDLVVLLLKLAINVSALPKPISNISHNLTNEIQEVIKASQSFQKIGTIKAVRAMTDFSLLEAKDLVDSVWKSSAPIPPGDQKRSLLNAVKFALYDEKKCKLHESAENRIASAFNISQSEARNILDGEVPRTDLPF